MVAIGIAVATVVSFLASAALYAIPPVSRLIARESTPRPGVSIVMQMATVVLRSLLMAGLLAGLMVAGNWHGAAAGAVLGVALITVPAVLLFGSVIHEGTLIRVAAVHFTDWAFKLVIIGALVGLFI
ncbi:MAG: DUF1761 family protein [Pseudolysinimonas sp.]